MAETAVFAHPGGSATGTACGSDELAQNLTPGDGARPQQAIDHRADLSRGFAVAAAQTLAGNASDHLFGKREGGAVAFAPQGMVIQVFSCQGLLSPAGAPLLGTVGITVAAAFPLCRD
ncbi:hypothetical protein GSbR_31020 [Geobacter sp. SVR]|nr:hypothetical protein GSVR_03550 [Geobacter sp. SVR]GCF86502.1 hypothetical protein GSbR_31020 [Geobacter sp. SVR]